MFDVSLKYIETLRSLTFTLLHFRTFKGSKLTSYLLHTF